MPGGNGTGPAGHGPLTGRKLGYCAGYQVPGFMNGLAYGRGLAHRRGPGRGFGRGHRSFSYQTPAFSYYPQNDGTEASKEDKVKYFKETARVLEDELNKVKKQLNELGESNTD